MKYLSIEALRAELEHAGLFISDLAAIIGKYALRISVLEIENKELRRRLGEQDSHKAAA
jgi:regulator of replication initiation timing